MKSCVWLLLFISFTVVCYGQSKPDSLRNLLNTSIEKGTSGAPEYYLSYLGYHFFTEKEYDSALYYYYKVLPARNEKAKAGYVAAALSGIGSIYSATGFADSAAQYYTEALQLFYELKDTTNIIDIESNLSIIYKDKGLYEKALKNSFNVLNKLKDKEPSRALASCYSTIGTVYDRAGDFAKALEYHQKSLTVRHAINYEKGVGLSYNNIGELYTRLKQYDSALANLSRSLFIKRKIGDTKAVGSTLNNMGDIYFELNQIEKSESYFTDALESKRQAKDRVGEAIALNNLALVSIARKDFKSAGMYLDQAEVLIRETGALERLRQNLELRITLSKTQRNYGDAFSASEELLIVKDSLLNIEKTESLKSLGIRYETDKIQEQLVILEERDKISQVRIKMLAIGIVLILIIAILIYQNSRIVRKNKRRVETLLKELHHRVKNNLQILSSLLTLQSQQLTDDLAIQAVKSSEGRVNAMALIHKKLYMGDENRAINIKEYITELVEYLVQTYGYAQKELKLDLQIEEIQVDVDKAIPMGLIINELVSNTFKYAFSNQPSPALKINLSVSKDSGFVVEITDNGSGVPSSVQIDSPKSFGLKMVKTLTRELRGQLKMNNENGASFLLNIPPSH